MRAAGATMVHALDDVVRAVGSARLAGAVVVGVDGRSGAGKTDLTERLCAALGDVRVLRLDDVYPGWTGLQRGLDHAVTFALSPLSRGEGGHYRRWDWLRSVPAEWVAVPPLRPGELLVVEGCGALAEPCAAYLDFGIWCEVPDAVRRRRAKERDGYDWEKNWALWAAQEEHLRHVRRADLCFRSGW